VSRLEEGIAYLAAQMSASIDEFRRDNAPAGDMLLQGLLSRGYAVEKAGRVALSPAGRRAHQALGVEPEPA
jgi:hypothetical protein